MSVVVPLTNLEAELAVSEVFGIPPAPKQPTPKPPTPDEVDNLCLAYDKAAADVEAAETKRDAAKAPLLAQVRAYGAVPANAERTRRLTGVMYGADSTTSTSIEVNEPAVDAFRSKLIQHRKSKLFAEIFEATTKHSLREGSSELLKLGIQAMPEAERAELLLLYAQCFSPKTKAPSLTVYLVAALRAKEDKKAAKAAAKDAKAQGKAKRGRKAKE
jgi:hypothetical protein